MSKNIAAYLLPEPTVSETALCRVLSGSAKRAAAWEQFEEGEYFVQVGRAPKKACVIARTSPPADNLVCSLLLVDTLRRNGARDITVVLPYFAYARQDRFDEPGDPLSAHFVIDQLMAAGATRFVALDVHSRRTANHYARKLIDVKFIPELARELKKHPLIRSGKKFTVVSPDLGARERATRLAAMLGKDVPVAWLRKQRRRFAGVTVRGLGGTTDGDTAVIVDDMVVTGDTVVHAVEALRRLGFKNYFLCATHPVFSGPAVRRLRKIGFERIIVSDSVPLSGEARRLPGLKVLPAAKLLAKAVRKSGK